MIKFSYLHCKKIVVPGRNTGHNGRAPPLPLPAHIHWASGWPRSAGSSRRRDRRALAVTGWAHRWSVAGVAGSAAGRHSMAREGRESWSGCGCNRVHCYILYHYKLFIYSGWLYSTIASCI